MTNKRDFANWTGLDTTLVVFFLALEIGQSSVLWSLETAVMSAALAAAMFMPYLLSPVESPGFGRWAFGRCVIAGFALLLGLVYGQTIGVALPEAFRFVPLTLLIISAVFSCYITFASFLGFRTAR